ncbi:MAG: hypothetical protein OXF67_10305 [Cyanobacteria bacterium MAG CAR4_bin_6]|nr:hypothetical protein [Cyanobacteria bacterium MAG CAR4_bin_6]
MPILPPVMAGNPSSTGSRWPLAQLLRLGQDLITLPTCPCCGGGATDRHRPCGDCLKRWAWPETLLHGREPMRFWAVGLYRQSWRSQLLACRQNPLPGVLHCAAEHLLTGLSWEGEPPVLMPIPGWKRRGNPLPEAFSQSLSQCSGWPQVQWLKKQPRPGQHHLGASGRRRNLQDAFRVLPVARHSQPGRLVFLVDDILTTGSTALAAAAPLEAAHIPVAGLLCLARTPPKGPRRPTVG